MLLENRLYTTEELKEIIPKLYNLEEQPIYKPIRYVQGRPYSILSNLFMMDNNSKKSVFVIINTILYTQVDNSIIDYLRKSDLFKFESDSGKIKGVRPAKLVYDRTFASYSLFTEEKKDGIISHHGYISL